MGLNSELSLFYAEAEKDAELERLYANHAAWEEQERMKKLLHDLESTVTSINECCKILIIMSYKDKFAEWLANRPQSVQDLAAKYPPGDYLIKEGAPYSVTAPGCTVSLLSYREDGEVGVLITAANKSEEAIEHEKMLCAQYNKTAEETEKIHETDVMAHVDPQWLELVNNDLD